MTVVSGVTETSKDIAPNGVLRAAINLGNPVLAQGTPAAPAGVTVDIARELGARLGVPVDLTCFAAALRRSGQDAALVAPSQPPSAAAM